MKSIYKLLIVSLVAITLVLSGCVQENETENGGTTEAGMSFTTVYISDAPSDNFSHINITFSQVKVHKLGDDNDSGWIFFDMEPKTIDMIYLHENNLSEELGVQNISVGNYSKLWIVVDSAIGVLKETGEEIVFDVPSGDLKVQQPFEIKEGNTSIDVELDLDNSVLYVPQGGVYKLTPQLGKVEINYEEDKDDDKDDEDEDEFEVDAKGDYEARIGEIIEFEGYAKGGVEPYNWSWDFGDGNKSDEQFPTHYYTNDGEFVVTLTVTDANGSIANDTTRAKIENDFEADAGGDYEAEVNQTIQFNGSAEHGIEPYTWYWDFGDETNSTEQNPQHTYTQEGEYKVVLTVTDAINNTATDETEAKIEEEEHDEIEFIADAGEDYKADINETIQFNGSAVGGVEPYSWYWDFGDGTNSTEQNPQHAYTAEGKYEVLLIVTDSDSQTAEDETEVEIEE